MSRGLFSGQRIPSEYVLLPTEEYYRRRYRSHQRGNWWWLLGAALAVLVVAMGARAGSLAGVAGGVDGGREGAWRLEPVNHLQSASGWGDRMAPAQVGPVLSVICPLRSAAESQTARSNWNRRQSLPAEAVVSL
ncbi:hypothetical protein [Microbulbifer guangxiensis]|uniref:hypothetical protein n=1 Tax=Microbulbifer guangxiensis TaxID=2904249 RepID=UPI001F34051C|nr:hypothetical protein [Microbulbifer guangxiensis]